jgi:hypothetical protein
MFNATGFTIKGDHINLFDSGVEIRIVFKGWGADPAPPHYQALLEVYFALADRKTQVNSKKSTF